MSSAGLSVVVLLLALVFYVFELLPIPVIAMGSSALMVILGVAPAASVWAAFGQDSVLLMGGMMLIGSTMFSTGAIRRIAGVIDKLAGGRARLSIFFMLLAAAVISAFMNNTTTAVMFLPLLLGVVARENSTAIREQKYVQALTILVGVGGMATLVGTPVNIVASDILAGDGYSPIGFFDFLPIAIPLVAVSLLYTFTVGEKIADRMIQKSNYRSDLVVNFIKDHEAAERKGGADRLSRAAIVSCIILVVTVIGLLTINLHGISMGTIGICGGLACVICRCISVKDAMRDISMSTILILGGTIGCAKALNDSGGGELIANFFLNLFGHNLSPYAAFAIMLLVSSLLTQITSNTGTVGILVPISIAISRGLGVSPLTMVFGVALAASCSFATPMASHLQAMVIDWGSYKFVDYLKYSGPITVVLIILLLILVPVFYPFVPI